MVQKVLGDDAMNAAQIKVENLLKVIHILEGLQQAEHLRLLNVYTLQPTKISNPGDSASIQPWFGTLRLLAFPKTKIIFEREGIWGH